MIAPDKFKGSLDAAQAAAAIDRGLRSGWPGVETEIVPMADGGEGTLEAFLAAGWRRQERTVPGPLGSPVVAAFGFDGTTAIVEMAAASGLALVAPARLDPRRASTSGTGALVRAALDAGARRIVLAVGGSATNDGGAGFLEALGVRFLDAAGRPLGPGGAELARLGRIDASGLDPRLGGVMFEVAVDVDNPLTGARGASVVFGSQKGATVADIAELDDALLRFASLSAEALGHARHDVPGAGAAGGLAFAALAYLGAALRPGWEIVADVTGLAGRLAGARLAITGEGRIDTQTAGGKTVLGVATLARAANVPVIAFGGSVDARAEAFLAERGVVCIPVSDGPRSLHDAIRDAGPLLARAAERVGRLLAGAPAIS